MAAKWYIKENGGKGELVGIASEDSSWFIAEEVLRKNAELICQLHNEQAADIKEQNFNSLQQLKAEIRSVVDDFVCIPPIRIAQEIDNLIYKLRELSAV